MLLFIKNITLSGWRLFGYNMAKPLSMSNEKINFICLGYSFWVGRRETLSDAFFYKTRVSSMYIDESNIFYIYP